MPATSAQMSVVLRFQVEGSRLEVFSERRRHARFDARTVAARLSLIRAGEDGLGLEPCTLCNVSYGGMCLRTQAELEAGQEHRFLLEMAGPFQELVLVKARICWVDPAGPQDSLAGAEFLESSTGWLGPEDD